MFTRNTHHGRLILVPIILASIFIALYHTHKTDDTYIFLTYARNIASGNGYVFNLGERVNATTSPLFTLLIALIAAPLESFVADPYVLASLLIQGTSLMLAMIFVGTLLYSEKFEVAAWVSGALLIANALLPLGMGMESYLTFALGMGALFFHLRDRQIVSNVLGGCAVLARPDMALLAAILVFDDWRRHRSFSRLAMACARVALPCAPWLIFSWFYFGGILPSTFAAKLAQTDTGRWGSGLLYLKGMHQILSCLGSTTPYLLALAAAASFKFMRESRCSMLILTWCSLHFGVYSFILNPPAYPWYYCIYALPISVVLALAIEQMYRTVAHLNPRYAPPMTPRWLERAVPHTRAIVAGGIVTATIMGALLRVNWSSHQPFEQKYMLYKQVAAWLNQRATEHPSVASNEVGVLGYYFRGTVIDPLGLISAEGAFHVQNKNYSWYLDSNRPDYVVTKEPPRPILEDYINTAMFQDHYAHVKTIRVKNSASRIYQRRDLLTIASSEPLATKSNFSP